ncbi:MAG: hypothetical protein L3K26_05925, partial [Candidatus Hydrogenedentes bacterium]|nr:hypothetical protein [Candidatus Hydrogenedentota bacterium]
MRFYTYSMIKMFPLLVVICLLATNALAQENPSADSADTGRTQRPFDPAFATIKPRVSYVPGIKVIRGETQVIVPEQKSFCPAGSVFKFNNGDIQV